MPGRASKVIKLTPIYEEFVSFKCLLTLRGKFAKKKKKKRQQPRSPSHKITNIIMAASIVVSVLVLFCAAAPAIVGGLVVVSPNSVYLKVSLVLVVFAGLERARKVRRDRAACVCVPDVTKRSLHKRERQTRGGLCARRSRDRKELEAHGVMKS